MFDNMESILYSLLPLILILLISWFFSFFGARMKKSAEQGATATKAPSEARRELMEIFFQEGGEQEARTSDVMQGRAPESPYGPGIGLAPPHLRGPEITSEPIKPKWWGA